MNKRPNDLTRIEFIEAFGTVYEHSPWLAEQLYDQGLTTELNDCQNLTNRFQQLFLTLPGNKQLQVINAHPDLAGKLALSQQLSENSTDEQSSAGLDQCSAEEFELFNHLNQTYKSKFKFPFIKAVKGQNRASILAKFKQRVNNPYQLEFDTALAEINKIAAFRLQDWFDKHQSMNLASANAGAEVLFATDDFFATKERLIQDHAPVFIEGKYDDHGKWMDGWESRRKRETGHDFCVIKLSQPGLINSIKIDTAFFTGNYPPCASVDAYTGESDPLSDNSNWQILLPAVSLKGNHKQRFTVKPESACSFLRLNIFPDGGVARLRVYGLADE